MADSFNEVSYANNDGMGGTWTAPWAEADEDHGGAATGRVRVDCGALVLSGTGSRVSREVDLSAARRAILRFDAHFLGTYVASNRKRRHA